MDHSGAGARAPGKLGQGRWCINDTQVEAVASTAISVLIFTDLGLPNSHILLRILQANIVL